MRREWRWFGVGVLAWVVLVVASALTCAAFSPRVAVVVSNPRAHALCDIRLRGARETAGIARLEPGAATDVSFVGLEDFHLRAQFSECDSAGSDEAWRCYEYLAAQWPLPVEPTTLSLDLQPQLGDARSCEPAGPRP